MPTLADIVLTAEKQDSLIADCVQMIERRIGARSGLRGIAMKTSLSLLKAAWPDILTRAMRVLLPEFVSVLDPLYQEFAATAANRRGDFASFLQARPADAAAALLGVTDARAAQAHNPLIKSVYGRLRRGAESEVGAALPEFAGLLSNALSRG